MDNEEPPAARRATMIAGLSLLGLLAVGTLGFVVACGAVFSRELIAAAALLAASALAFGFLARVSYR